MDIVIYHNPECGTSRNVLATIKAAGYTPTVIEYLKTGWTKSQLLGLFAAAGLTPRTALRETKSPAAELGLLDEGVSNEVILDAMINHPILVNRPIVCRPGRSIKKMENCSLIMMGVALAELNFASEEANPRNANLQRSMWYRR